MPIIYVALLATRDCQPSFITVLYTENVKVFATALLVA